MEHWSVEQVCEFLSRIEELPAKAKDSAVAQAREKGLDGDKLVQCISTPRCQDFFDLNIVHCQTICRSVKEGVVPLKSPPPPTPDSTPATPASADAAAAAAAALASPVDKRAADIARLNFDAVKITSVSWVSGGLGSTGVFFTNSSDGMFVVKPCSPRTAGEIFASILAARLGVLTAAITVPEELQQGLLLSKLLWAPFKVPEDKERLRNDRVAVVTVMEYVPGQPLSVCAMQMLNSDKKRLLLVELGRMILLDVLVNNFDRLPLAWNNEGNPDNVMVRTVGSRIDVVAIDHTVVCITNDEGHQRYLEVVQAAMRELAAREFDGPSMKRVRDSLLNLTGYQLDDEGCVMLTAGVRDGIRRLAQLQDREPAWAANVLQETEARLGGIATPAGLTDLSAAFVTDVASRVLASDLAKQ